VEQYGQDENKIEVVHNGMEVKGRIAEPVAHQRDHKVVLFLGRITMQKGPEYFVDMAQRVCEQRDDVRFIVVGWGDMGPMMIERVIHAGLASKVLFTGFLRGKDVERAFANADVYVMPSISEPFGLTPLEALRHGVPVVISKRSGVAEVLTMGALKVDFWDIDKMADYVLAVLNRPALSYVLAKAGGRELRRLTWDKAAKKCLRIYHRVLDIPEPPKPKAVIDPTKPVKPMMGGEDAPDDLSDLVDDEQPGLSPGA
jgi:glycosyltransferase involved in cell wall biosynthesis